MAWSSTVKTTAALFLFICVCYDVFFLGFTPTDTCPVPFIVMNLLAFCIFLAAEYDAYEEVLDEVFDEGWDAGFHAGINFVHRPGQVDESGDYV